MKSIRSAQSLGSYGRTSVTIRYNALRALVLICALALGPLAHSQPAPGGIVTRKVPSTTLLSDSAGNLYFTGSVSPGQITPSPGAPQPQPGGGTCIASPSPFLPRPCTDAFLEKTHANGNLLFATYLGGPTDDFGSKLAIDSAGHIYVAGITGGSFPTTPHAAVPASADAGTFIAKFSPDGGRSTPPTCPAILYPRWQWMRAATPTCPGAPGASPTMPSWPNSTRTWLHRTASRHKAGFRSGVQAALRQPNRCRYRC